MTNMHTSSWWWTQSDDDFSHFSFVFSFDAESSPTESKGWKCFFWVWLVHSAHENVRKENFSSWERAETDAHESEPSNTEKKTFLHPTQHISRRPRRLMDEKAFPGDWYRRKSEVWPKFREKMCFPSESTFSRESREDSLLCDLDIVAGFAWTDRSNVTVSLVTGLAIRWHVIEQFERWDLKCLTSA